jgi:hypothetical protein
MFTVGYLPLGNDATVNWGTVDFKFKNNTEYPIKIEAFMEDEYLTVKLHGTKTNTNYIEVQYVVISTTPFETIEQEDPSVAPGTKVEKSGGHTGYVVDTYRYLYDENDNLIEKTFIDRSPYRVQNKVYGAVCTQEPSESRAPHPVLAE